MTTFHTNGGHRIRVGLGRAPYDVVIGRGLLDQAGTRIASLTGAAGSGRCFIAADDALPDDHVHRITQSLTDAGLAPSLLRLHASETDKSLRSVESVLAALANARLERDDPVIALGGGVIGDMAGFAAAVYRRGVPVVQCPTTLLAMVDASVGGKTGVNLTTQGRVLKNMVGAFHQPVLVLADVDTLDSLPQRHLRSGLAECCKHGLIAGAWGDPALLDWTIAHADAILQRDPDAIAQLVARNVRVKAVVVADDELERAQSDTASRALLNLGHTFAHAIETIDSLSPTDDPRDAPLHHGEAVALGLVAAARVSVEMGLAPPVLFQETRRALQRLGLPVAVAGLPGNDALIDRMHDDKKARAGRLRLVLPVINHKARVVDQPPRHAIEAGLDAIRA